MKPTHSNGEVAHSQRAIATKVTAAGKNGHPETLPRLGLHGPHVSLGMENSNGLITSSLIATAIVGVLFAALTVGPYLANRVSGPQTDAAKQPEQVKPDTPEPTPAAPPTPETAPKKTPDPSKPTGTKTDIVGKLGENVTKPASPSSNPLDKKEDDILKDLNK